MTLKCAMLCPALLEGVSWDVPALDRMALKLCSLSQHVRHAGIDGGEPLAEFADDALELGVDVAWLVESGVVERTDLRPFRPAGVRNVRRRRLM